MQLRELEARHRALWDEYARSYRATNRPLNLNHIGRVWNGVSDSLAKLAQEIEDGAFPPKTEKDTLAIFDFDDPGDNAWQERLGTGMVLRTAKGIPEIIDGGPSGAGTCLRLPDGAHLEAVDEARLLDFGIAPFLVEAWVRHEGQREQQYGASIFSYGLGGGFRLGLNHRGEVLFTLYGIGEATGTESVVPPDGAWHHVAVNFHDCHIVDVYVDGKLTENLNLRGAPRKPSNPLIRIGNEIGLVTPFAGDIDRIRVSRGIYGAEELDASPEEREAAKP
jgi:hypothetical protein